jgi:DNA-directed RNA polymerase alpha subunit
MSKKIVSFLSQSHESSVFLHCIDSRLEGNGNWYSRVNIGPFSSGSGLQIGSRLRRALLNDLTQTSITAVKLEGAVHEFSRLPGVQKPVLDLLFQFRKVVLYAPLLQLGKPIIVSFFFSGPGIFYAKDFSWPNGIQCGNPELRLVALAPGSILRGRMLVQKTRSLGSIRNYIKPLYLGEPWINIILKNAQSPKKSYHRIFALRSVETSNFGQLSLDSQTILSNSYPWLSLGFSTSPVRRVGFRIESLGPLNQQNEVLIFEILTNGSISPRQALREASLIIVHKFAAISNLMLPTPVQKEECFTTIHEKYDHLAYFFDESVRIKNLKIRNFHLEDQRFYDTVHSGCFRSDRYLGLELSNLEMTKGAYFEFRNLGIQTLEQLLRALASKTCNLSPNLKKQREYALFRLGFFPCLGIFLGQAEYVRKQTFGRHKIVIAKIKYGFWFGERIFL